MKPINYWYRFLVFILGR